MQNSRKMKKQKWSIWLKRIITTAVLLFLFLQLLQFDPQDLIYSTRQIPLWALILLFALQIVTQLMINFQWHQVAKSFTSPIKFTEMLYLNAQAQIIHIAPAGHIGGDVFRAVQIKRAGNISGEQSASIVAIQKLFSLGAFFTISLLSIGFFIGEVPWLQETYIRFLLYGLLFIILAVLSSIFIIPHKISGFFKSKWKNESRFLWVNKLRLFIITSLEHVVYLRKSPKLLAKLTAIAMCIWALYPLKLYLLAFHLMPGINILHISAATFLSYTVAMIPIFPGGLGGFEVTMTSFLYFLGFTQSGALVITVLFRFATFWFITLLSLLYMAVHRLLCFKIQNLTAFTQRIECLTSEIKVLYKLAEKYYASMVESEAVLAGIDSDDHILCIGGGLCPFSAILFHQKTGAKVTVIDNNEKCVPKARKLIKRLGLCDHINVFLEDGCSADILYADFSVVHLALQVYPLEKVFSSVENGIIPGTKLLVRQPRKIQNNVYGKFSDIVLTYCSCVKHRSRNVGSTFL